MGKKNVKRMISFLVVLTLLGACGQPQPQSQSKSTSGAGKENSGSAVTDSSVDEKVVTMATTSAWDTIYPFAQGSGITDSIDSMIWDTLVYYDEKNEPKPRLAQSWEISKDGLVYTVHLAEKAVWSDGEPVTADDIIFSVEIQTDPELPNPGRTKCSFYTGTDDAGARTGAFEDVGVKKIDDKTVAFTLKKPIGEKMFFAYIPLILPAHCLKDADRQNLQADPFWEKPVCSGPFIYDREVEGESIEMVRNPDYHLGAPDFGRLIIKVVNAASLLPGLMSGEIDVLVGNSAGSLPISDYEMAKEQKQLKVEPVNSGAVLHMPINLTKEYLQDKRVRQAFEMAIDKQRIVDNVLGGLGEVIWSPYNPNTLSYIDPGIKGEYNPDKAKQLLEEAGWDFSRVLELCQPTGSYLREQAAILVQQDLEAIGVKTEIITLDYATQMAYLSDKKLDLSFMGGSTDVKKPYYMVSCYDPTVAWCWSHNEDPKYRDKLYESLEYVEEDKIAECYHEFQKMQLEDVPEVWICNEYEIIVYNQEKLQNVMIPQSANCPWTVWEWDVQY